MSTNVNYKSSTKLSKMARKSKLRNFLSKDIKRNQLRHPDAKKNEYIGFNFKPYHSITSDLNPSTFFNAVPCFEAPEIDNEADSLFEGSDTSPPQVPIQSRAYNAHDQEASSRWGTSSGIDKGEETTEKKTPLQALKDELEEVLERHLCASAREKLVIDRKRVALIRQIASLEAEEEETKVRRKGTIVFLIQEGRWK